MALASGTLRKGKHSHALKSSRKYLNEIIRTYPTTFQNPRHHTRFEDRLPVLLEGNSFQQAGIDAIQLIAGVAFLCHLHDGRANSQVCSQL
jgi:hypothetical protein